MSDTTTASELLIKIKTDLEGKGLDDAIAKVDQLIGMQSQSTAALQTNKEEQSNSAKEMEKASRAAWAMNMAARGSTEGIRGLSNAASALGATLGGLVARVTMVGAAFMAGWKVGAMIREQLIDPLISATDETDKAALSAVAAATQYKTLNSASMASLVKELSGIEAKTNDVIAAIGRAYKNQNELELAKSNTNIARIIATQPEGPDRDKKIAAEKATQEVSQAQRIEREAQQTIAMNEAAVAAADQKVADLLEKRDLAHSKRANALIDGRQLSGAEALQYRTSEEEANANLEAAGLERDNLRNSKSESTQDAQNKIDIAAEQKKQAQLNYMAAVSKADAEISDAQKKKAALTSKDDVSGLQKENRSERERLLSSIQPLTQEADGTRTSAVGNETRASARDIISAGISQVTAQSGDKEADDRAIRDLIRALQENQTASTMSYKDIEAAVRRLEANTAEIRARQRDLESRERTAPGLM